MLVRNFDQLNNWVKSMPKKKVVIAVAENNDIIKLAKIMEESGIADCLLVGDSNRIRLIAKESGIELKPEQIVHVSDEKQAAEKAVSLVRENKADLIMKGHIPTADFLKPVLDKDRGLRGNGLLSQVTVFEKVSGQGFQFLSDCAVNISPGLLQKRQIIKNCVQLAKKIGYSQPRVALLASLETVTPDMPETIEAAQLSKLEEQEQGQDYFVYGPLALDNAVSMEAAQCKGINGNVAGRADILIVPDIQVGNVLHKALVYFAQKRVAGLVLGAKIPIIMSSRSDNTESKLLSVALASYLLNGAGNFK